MLTVEQMMKAARLMYQTGGFDDVLGAAMGAPSCQRSADSSPLTSKQTTSVEPVTIRFVLVRHTQSGERQFMPMYGQQRRLPNGWRQIKEKKVSSRQSKKRK